MSKKSAGDSDSEQSRMLHKLIEHSRVDFRHVQLTDNPHDKEMLALIDSGWGDFEKELHSKVGHLLPEYLKWQQRGLWAIALSITGPILFASLGEEASQSEVIVGLILLFISFGISGWIIRRMYLTGVEFNKAFNPLIFEKAFQILGLTGVHTTKESVTEEEIISLLDHSELITQNRNLYEIDDMIATKFHGRSLFMAELAVRHTTGSGRRRGDKLLFHGFFAVHDLPRRLEGKTFITTENDKWGFGGLFRGHRLVGTPQSLRETLLEWNDFENKLHVATTNEVEARYILTPDFMAELYEWWKERGGNIRVSFLENRMYVLLPDRDVRIGISTIGFKEKNLKYYMLTVMRPVWHLKQLMKHAEARLRSL